MRDVVESMTHKYTISWKISNKSNKKIQFTTIAMQTTIYYIYIGLARMGRWWYMYDRVHRGIARNWAANGCEQKESFGWPYCPLCVTLNITPGQQFNCLCVDPSHCHFTPFTIDFADISLFWSCPLCVTLTLVNRGNKKCIK